MFQFTHPVRGATSCNDYPTRRKRVSIHAPREGCDGDMWYNASARELFQFTHPVRGATTFFLYTRIALAFQFTHPVRGATVLLAGMVDA